MKKTITVREFADELIARIAKEKTVDCCKPELVTFAKLAQEKMGNEKIEVDWKD